MAGGRKRAKGTEYRDGQNIIRDSSSRRIVYMPPEAKDVPPLMKAFVEWLSSKNANAWPCPIRAGIAHYQFATIHPYYDGNGRTARLLTTLVLHAGGYDLKGLYSLEEYYARDLGSYYDALTVGPSHNYYAGRVQADVTRWVECFSEGVADSFESVNRRAREAASQGVRDQSAVLRKLDGRQRKALDLFRDHRFVTSGDVEVLFGIGAKPAQQLGAKWLHRCRRSRQEDAQVCMGAGIRD